MFSAQIIVHQQRHGRVRAKLLACRAGKLSKLLPDQSAAQPPNTLSSLVMLSVSEASRLLLDKSAAPPPNA
jgi:hypothetical protein